MWQFWSEQTFCSRKFIWCICERCLALLGCNLNHSIFWMRKLFHNSKHLKASNRIKDRLANRLFLMLSIHGILCCSILGGPYFDGKDTKKTSVDRTSYVMWKAYLDPDHQTLNSTLSVQIQIIRQTFKHSTKYRVQEKCGTPTKW